MVGPEELMEMEHNTKPPHALRSSAHRPHGAQVVVLTLVCRLYHRAVLRASLHLHHHGSHQEISDIAQAFQTVHSLSLYLIEALQVKQPPTNNRSKLTARHFRSRTQKCSGTPASGMSFLTAHETNSIQPVCPFLIHNLDATLE